MEKSIWATQRLNEKVLNAAYEQSKVILIFSVCKSMHFQGYAEMASPIGSAKYIEWDSGDPRSKGGRSKWGGAFTCNWIKIHDLPFHATTKICNPMNQGKPVKFSRDGQEATESCARALMGMLDEGAMKNGNGSCILRKNVRLQNGTYSRQKWLVNGKFVDKPPSEYFNSSPKRIPRRKPVPIVRPVVPPIYAKRQSPLRRRSPLRSVVAPLRGSVNPYSTNLQSNTKLISALPNSLKSLDALSRNISRIGRHSRSRSSRRSRRHRSRDRSSKRSRSRDRKRRRSRTRSRSRDRRERRDRSRSPKGRERRRDRRSGSRTATRDRKKRKRRRSREREINLYALHQNLQLHQALQNQLSQTDPNILSQLNLGMSLGLLPQQ